MATRDVEGRAASKVYRLARGFGDDGETVVGYITFLRDNRVGAGVIIPLAGLIESTLVGNKPSAGSQSVVSGASGIVRNVVSGKWDKRGSDTVLRFIRMATAIPTRTGEQTAEDLKVQARVVSGISCFIENLSLYPAIKHTDLQDILGLTTSLLEMCFKHGKVKDAVLIAENLLPVSTSASPVEKVKSIVLDELGRIHAQLLRQMPEG
jgi:hypothetical protein